MFLTFNFDFKIGLLTSCMRSSGLRRTAENPATLTANQKRRFIVRAERHTGDAHLLLGADLGTQLAWQTLSQQYKPITTYHIHTSF